MHKAVPTINFSFSFSFSSKHTHHSVVRIPSKFDPSLLVVEEEIIRKIEQIAFRKFEAFEERLFKKVESLVGPLQSKL